MVTKGTELAPIDGQDAASIIESFIPYFSADSKKTRYLSFRATGFPIREAIQLTNLKSGQRLVQKWRREDSTFAYLDGPGIMELQKVVGSHFTYAEFMRNMRLIMEKDYRVLRASLNDDIELNENDLAYLLKIRPFYTPQQLASIKTALDDSHKEASTTKVDILQIIMNSEVKTQPNMP